MELRSNIGNSKWSQREEEGLKKKLLNKVRIGEVKKVVIEYPDKLVRFGYE
jgi:predicted site-specific integrase-resolvase